MHRHSGYPGGLKSETYAEKMARKPEQAVMDTIRHDPEDPPRAGPDLQAQGLCRADSPSLGVQNPQPLEIAHAKYEARA